MEPTVKKESAEKIPFLERSIVRTILPIAGFVIICVLFAILTDGKLFKPKKYFAAAQPVLHAPDFIHRRIYGHDNGRP